MYSLSHLNAHVIKICHLIAKNERTKEKGRKAGMMNRWMENGKIIFLRGRTSIEEAMINEPYMLNRNLLSRKCHFIV